MKIKKEEILNFFKENNNIDIKYGIKIDSEKPGKNILITGSVHGNEPVGSDFAYKFINDFKNKKITLESGSITFILANYKAFKENKRYINTDMNRIFNFPEDKKDTFEYKRAKEISKYISNNNFDFGIDLHSVSVGDFKMYICDNNDKELMNLLKETSVVDTLFYFNDEYIPGTLMNYLKKYNGKGVGLECGNHLDDNAINIAEKQVSVLLNKFNIIKNKNIDENIISKDKLTIYNVFYKIKTGENFKWLIEKPTTDVFIKKDQEISIDSNNGIQKAPKDCYLVMPSKEVKSSDNDAGFLATKE